MRGGSTSYLLFPERSVWERGDEGERGDYSEIGFAAGGEDPVDTRASYLAGVLVPVPCVRGLSDFTKS